MAWLPGWKRRIPITIDPTTISGGLSENLTDFPALIKISSSSGRNNADLTKVFNEFLVEVDSDDTFTGTNNDPPNEVRWFLWSLTDDDYPYISSNKLRMNTVGSTTDQLYAKSNFKLVGDFDIQVDWQMNNHTAPTSSHHYMYFQVQYDGGGSAYIARTMKPDTSPRYIANPPSNEKTGTADYGPGKFRITRVGTVTKVFYWSSGMWQWEGSSSGYTTETTTTGDARVYLRYIRRDAATWDVSWDNFTINSADGVIKARSDENKQKIAITISDGTTQCPAEIDYWDPNREMAYVWAKIPTLSSGTNTQLYLYYNSELDNNTAYIAAAPTSASGVWEDNYVGVWHMSQRPYEDVTDRIEDSSINVLHATPKGSMVTADYRYSLIGASNELDGVDEYLLAGNDSKFNVNYITVEAVIKTDQAATSQLVSKDDNPDQRSWQFRKNATGELSFIPFRTNSELTTVTGSTDLSDNVDHYVVGSWDGNTVRVYIDGYEENSTTFTGTLNSSTSNVRFGAAETDDPGYFDGTIDEVRISNVARSGDWIRTSNQSIFDNLLTFDDAEYLVGISNTTSPTFPSHDEATLYGSIPSSNHDGIVSVYYGTSDEGTVKASWQSSVSIGLQTSGSSFTATLSGLAPLTGHYYRWFTTYSGSEPSEEWSPSYYFFTNQGRILKGTSTNFIAITAEPNSTFYNTSFAVASRGEGAALNAIYNDVVRQYWLSSPEVIDSDTGLELTIDSSKISSTKTDFPVFVRLSDSSGINDYDNTSIFDDLGANSKKLKVVTADGTECYVEIERWDNSGKEAELWVKVPSISATEDTTLYMKWNNSWADNTTYVGDIGSTAAKAVWGTSDSGMVYHLNQDPTGGSGCILDSSTTIRNGTPTNAGATWTSGDLVDGRLGIGKCLYFGDKYIDIGSQTFSGNQMTISCWAYANSLGGKSDYCGLITQGTSAGNIRIALFYDGPASKFKGGHAGTYHWLLQNGTFTSTGTWVHVVVVTEASDFRIYLNGSQSNISGCGHTLPTTGTWFIGRRHDSTGSSNTWTGRLDEVRVFDSTKGASYIAAQYESERDNLITFSQPIAGQIREPVSDLASVR